MGNPDRKPYTTMLMVMLIVLSLFGALHYFRTSENNTIFENAKMVFIKKRIETINREAIIEGQSWHDSKCSLSTAAGKEAFQLIRRNPLVEAAQQLRSGNTHFLWVPGYTTQTKSGNAARKKSMANVRCLKEQNTIQLGNRSTARGAVSNCQLFLHSLKFCFAYTYNAIIFKTKIFERDVRCIAKVYKPCELYKQWWQSQVEFRQEQLQ